MLNFEEQLSRQLAIMREENIIGDQRKHENSIGFKSIIESKHIL